MNEQSDWLLLVIFQLWKSHQLVDGTNMTVLWEVCSCFRWEVLGYRKCSNHFFVRRNHFVSKSAVVPQLLSIERKGILLSGHA